MDEVEYVQSDPYAFQKGEIDMDITVNQTGVRKNFYEFPSDVGAALVHAGLAFQIVKAAPAPKPVARWFVGDKPNGGPADYILVWTDGQGALMYFNGTPEAYLKKPPVYCGLEAPRVVSSNTPACRA